MAFNLEDAYREAEEEKEPEETPRGAFSLEDAYAETREPALKEPETPAVEPLAEYGFGDVLRGGVQSAGARLDRAVAGLVSPFDFLDPVQEHLEGRAEHLEGEAAKVPGRGILETIAGAGAGLPIDALNAYGLGRLTGVPSWLRWPVGIGLSETAQKVSEDVPFTEAAATGLKHGVGALAFPAVGRLPMKARVPILGGVGAKIATSEGDDPFTGGGLYALGGIAPTAERGRRLAPGKELRRDLTKVEREAIEEATDLSAVERAELAKAQSKIGALPEIQPGKIGDRTRERLADDLQHILRMERDTFGRQIKNGAYETARKLRAVPAIVEGMVNWGIPKIGKDGTMTWAGEPMKDIFEKVASDPRTLARFQLYAVGRQADELMKQNREFLFTKPQIEAMKKLEAPGFDRAFRRQMKNQEKVADFLQESGVISAKQRALWRRYQYAHGFFRERGPNATRGMGSALGGEQGVHVLRGSQKNLKDPLESMIEGPGRLIQLALENRARVKIADMAGKSPQFLEKIAPGSKRIVMQVKNLEEAIRQDLRKTVVGMMDDEVVVPKSLLRRGSKDRPGAMEGTTQETMERVLREDLTRNGFREIDELMEAPGMVEVINYFKGGVKPFGDDVMTVFRNGEREYYRIKDAGLLRSLEAFRRPEATGAMKWINSARRLVQASVTLDPTFWARNLTRDVAMSSIMTRTGLQSITANARALKAAMFHSKDYKEFVLNGGGGASFYDGGANLRRQLVKHAQRKGFNPKGLIVTPKDVYHFLDRLGRIGEELPRVGEFKRGARNPKIGPERAGFLAREITTDFSMTGNGKAAQFMAKSVPFFNAMVVGGDRMYRSVLRDPDKKALTAAKMAMVPIMGGALHLINREREDYKKLPDWDKWSYWHFFLDDPDTGETEHFKMPKLWEVGSLSSITERMLEQAYDDQDPDQKLYKDLGKIIMDNFGLSLPVGASQVFEQARGKRTFTGEHIEPMGISRFEPWARAKSTTSPTFKAIGKATRNNPRWAQIPPSRAEALYRGIFNAWADHSLGLLDDALFPNKRPSAFSDQRAVLKAFKERPGKYNRYVSKFYSLSNEMNEIYNTIREFDKSDDPEHWEIAEDKLADPRQNAAYSLQKDTRKSLKYVQEERRAIKAIRNDPDMNAEEKRERIEELRLDLEQYMEERWRDWASEMYPKKETGK